jgi:hypothetical protein
VLDIALHLFVSKYSLSNYSMTFLTMQSNYS